MLAPRLVGLIAFAALTLGSDPVELVRKLGAPRYADRQAASTQIEELGADALPALRMARASNDAEVRLRAVALLDRIEKDLMVQPTRVALDFRDKPLGEALETLVARGHATVRLDPALAARRVTLVRPERIPFWEALDLVAQAGGAEVSTGPLGAGFGGDGASAVPLDVLASLPGQTATPACRSGPFRVVLQSLAHHKERVYLYPLANPGMIPFRANPGALPRPPMLAGEAGLDQFSAMIQVVAEPRISITLAGEPQIIEARDDRGQSLLGESPTGEPSVLRHVSGYNQPAFLQGPVLQVALRLKYPDHPGRLIRRLRGRVPVTVTARKSDPLSISLADAKGKSYHVGDLILTIHDVASDPISGPATIDLSMQAVASVEDPNHNLGMFPQFGGLAEAPAGLGVPMLRGSWSPQEPIEIVDAQGHPVARWDVASQMHTSEEMRATVRILPAPGAGPAIYLRCHELTRVNTEAEFEFADVEMP